MKLQLIEKFCLREDLSSEDLYDIWKTRLGFHVKNYYNCHNLLGLIAAAPLTIFDTFINNRTRLFYARQEYPIVRAFAALSLLNLYQTSSKQIYLDYAIRHLQWLVNNSCTGYSGYCWGLHFKYAVSCGLVYDSNMPFSTMTPYPLEAFIKYSEITGDKQFDNAARSILDFFTEDIQVMEETDSYMATSYVPLRDRIVVNAASYTMYSFSLLLPYVGAEKRNDLKQRINKLYAFVRNQQKEDGSWLYSPEGRPFIDCFHTCIVIKNLFKTSRIVHLRGSEGVIRKGYSYLEAAFLDGDKNLFRRFSLSNKPSLVKYDLYDNAEVLNLAILLEDAELATRLESSIRKHFCHDGDIYSQIDTFGFRRNKNMLRWAVMPYLYALSKMV